MKPVIERLAWDSECFGYEVGSLTTGQESFDNLLEVVSSDTDKKLIYLRSPYQVKLDDNVFEDEKVNFEFILDPSSGEIGLSPLPAGITLKTGLAGDESSLLPLALASGEFSRFKLDPGFSNGEFEKLYSIWLKNSLQETFNGKAIYSLDAQGPNGLIVLKGMNRSIHIDLVAVAGRSRGAGLGKILLEQAVMYARNEKRPRVTVDTQRRNRTAINFYRSFGFREIGSSFIYHFWK